MSSTIDKELFSPSFTYVVTMKITFGISRILILNNFLIGHAVKAANEKAGFFFHFNWLFHMVFVLHLCL